MASVTLEQLRRIPIFVDLDAETLESLTRLARIRKCAPREIIVYQDEPAAGVQLMTVGRASVSVTTRDGRATTIGELGPGEIIGEISLLDGGTPSATVTAITRTELICIDRQPFLDLLEQKPRMCIGLLAVIAGRLRRLTRWADDLAGLPLPARLAKCLMALLTEHGQQTGPRRVRIGLKISQNDLATRVGGSRESVNKTLRRMERSGVLTQEAGHLVITDLTQLQGAAKGD
jgi:CRP/FNR family cyclic AMP-dependent transcriptional regulator